MDHSTTIARMTLEEKCALLSGGDAFGSLPLEHRGIPRMQFSDGPHGLRLQAGGANHLGIGGSVPATCFPTAATVANSWDPALGEELGAALGEEALAQGVDVVLGPGLNIKRSPLCGRNFEYFSEDPLVSGAMASAYVRGIQSKGVSACPKHFAVNSQETRRQASDSIVDERTLREIYLAGFEKTVAESDPDCIMTSYNLVNGTYVNEDGHLLRDVLRGEWGYQKAVVTDWIASVDHPRAVAMGSTFEMPAPGLASVRELVEAVERGEVSEASVDARVSEALDIVFKTTAATKAAKAQGKAFDEQAHHELARKIAAESVVLLKNEADVLPLAPGTRVALVGDFANEPRYQGAGSSLVNVTRLDTLTGSLASSGLEPAGYAQGFERDGSQNDRLVREAVELARGADVVVVNIGLDESRESEGAERTDLSIGAGQERLLEALAAENVPVIALLSAGSAVETHWAGSVDALVYLALGGQAGASAALDVLTGAVNPSGKLTESWPHRLEDTPCAGNFPAQTHQALYTEGLYVGYRYYQKAGVPVAYPFGHGLSYTRFSYSGLSVTKVADKGGSLSVRVRATVTNTGPVAGAEVVQVYTGKEDRAVFGPVRELRAFDKVFLEPGESRELVFELNERAFAYYNVKTGGWEVEAGAHSVEVAASSEDVRLSGSVALAGSGAPNPYEGRDLAVYESGQVQGAAREHLAALLGRPIPEEKVTIDGSLCFGDFNHGRSPLFWLVWAVLEGLKRSGEKKGRPNLNVLFVYNMPLHALAKSSGGLVSRDMIDALVLELKGFWFLGLGLCAARFVKNLLKNRAFAKRLAAAAQDGAPSSEPAQAF